MPVPNVIQIGDSGEVVAVDIDPAVEIVGAEIPPWGGAKKLDELTDVEGADAGFIGQALIKGLGGIWRPGTVSGGGSSTMVILQATPAATWSITHNLGHYPQVTVLGLDNRRLLPDLEYGSVNQVTVTHAEPLAGITILT
jgi:hypothetical protein